jgi:hypothetical protein
MANAQNVRSAALPPAGHLHRLQIQRVSRTSEPPTPLVDDRWSSVPSLRVEPDEGDTILFKRSDAPPPIVNRSPAIATKEAHDMVRTAVEEALAPVRDRLEELEKGMLRILVQVAKVPAPADATSNTDQARERERRQLMGVLIVMGGLIVVDVAALVGVLASYH